ncbi:hypothetical protein [Phytohabitans suffuscus]|uniref:Tat pathway signal sequence domain protein n=1 Tax=Phytohabitans suffuscus TaxID=624315 RepID=A0A6F8Y9F3_9ACTN|nr:hypothetical protein [Phytohabitans suffuscus]BCB82754.1 hypothetical protein Psuf_000670 [Phytohabitans suffuscus]
MNLLSPTLPRWSRRTLLAAASVVLSLATVGVVPASAASGTGRGHGRPAPVPAPPQVRQMDFLLGKYDCRLPDDPTGPVQVRWNTRRGLDGHYYYAEVWQFFYNAAVPDVHALGVYGWNPVDQRITLQYHDNWGSAGTGSSPGWQDGHLRFAGDLLQVTRPSPTGVTTGIHLRLTDDWVIVSPGHFTVAQVVTLPDGSSVTGAMDCRRARG